jgi:hypothetical protein
MATTTSADTASGGSVSFFVLALATICALALFLVRYYLPLRTTPAHVSVPVFLAIALPASIVVLLPIDLASTAATQSTDARGITLPDTVIYKSWRIVYWLTFALTWFILPLLGEYADSGYREPRARAIYALRSNGRYWMIISGCSVVASVYLIWSNGLELDTFKSLAMALAYTWGLILGIYLMGHGLVAFPRSLFRYANLGRRLRHIQGQAPKVHEKLTEALEKLESYEDQVVQLQQRKTGSAREFHDWIDELAEGASLPESRTAPRTATTIPPVVTERYMAELTRKLKRARHAKCRFEREWDRLVHKAVRTQAILDSQASQRLEFATHRTSFLDRPILTPFLRHHLHVYVVPALTYLASAVGVLASICIVWSECVREVRGHQLSLIGLSIVHRSQIGFGGQLTAAAWLCYMCICAFYSLTEVKIWGNRALVRRHTYAESATWYGLQVAKLTVPLSYNFLTLTDASIFKHTNFHTFLGRLIDLSPLGAGFSAFFPIFILVPVAATAFGLYGRVKTVAGFGDLLADDDNDDGAGSASWREGRALLERAKQATGTNAVGLASRDAGSAERYTDDPVPSTAAGASQVRAGRRRAGGEEDGDDDVGGFFDTFAARVRNTFDGADISRPSWLGGDDAGGSSRGARSTAGGDRSNGFMSLFGGRAEEGRVRL